MQPIIGKLSRYTRDIEDLRCDLLSIIYCLKEGSQNATDTALFVLSERLISYPFHRNMDDEVGAFSSCIYLQCLIDEGVVDDKAQFKHIDCVSLLKATEKLSLKIREAEERIAKEPSAASRRKTYISWAKDIVGGASQAKDIFINIKKEFLSN